METFGYTVSALLLVFLVADIIIHAQQRAVR